MTSPHDPHNGFNIRSVTSTGLLPVASLCTLLQECVTGGASLGFVLPFGTEKAQQFWEGVSRSVDDGSRTLLVVEDPAGNVIGTVQLVVGQPDNQRHRADVSKLLVSPSSRRQGLARALMTRVEALAAEAGKSLLVLDTATGSVAESMYERLGWQRCGVIPDFASMPDGTLCGTTIFWKAV